MQFKNGPENWIFSGLFYIIYAIINKTNYNERRIFYPVGQGYPETEEKIAQNQYKVQEKDWILRKGECDFKVKT